MNKVTQNSAEIRRLNREVRNCIHYAMTVVDNDQSYMFMNMAKERAAKVAELKSENHNLIREWFRRVFKKEEL